MLLGTHMLLMAGIANSSEQAQAMLKEKITDGSGLKRLQQMIALQGGDASYLCVEQMERLTSVRKVIDLPALQDGYVTSMMAEKIGTAAQILGAGRAVKSDVIDPAVGLVMKVRVGDQVHAGDPICTLYVNDDTNLEEAKKLLYEAVTISDTKQKGNPMIHEVITAENL